MSELAPAVTVLGLNYPPEATGISPYTGAMTRGLRQRGHRTRVVTTHPHYPEWRLREGYGEWRRDEELHGVQVRRVRHFVPATPKGFHRLHSELSFGTRLLFTDWRRPDVIVTVSPALFASALARVRARLLHRRTPFVVWVQDLYSLGLRETGQANGLVGRITHAIEGWLFRSADAVVVIHDRFATRVMEDFGLDQGRVHVVRNWTHLPPAAPIDREQARIARGWGDEVIVLHAGNMGVKQGLDNVVRAAEVAERRGERVRFVMMGNGSERERLRDEGGALSTIEFLDPLPDDEFAAALAAADVLLVNELPGVSEMAVPSKLTSYFSTGRPVLAATDPTGITADEVRAANAGVVVPAGSPDALLDAAVKLGRDAERARRLGANGRNYRETVLDEGSAIDSFATLLATLVDQDRRHRRRTPARRAARP